MTTEVERSFDMGFELQSLTIYSMLVLAETVILVTGTLDLERPTDPFDWLQLSQTVYQRIGLNSSDIKSFFSFSA